MRNPDARPVRKNIYLYLAVIAFIIFYLVYQFIKSYTDSLFYSNKDRVNIVMYGPYTAVYSFGISDNQDYIIPFSPDLKIDVPGGYGQYRVGSVGKLIKLDKKYDVYNKSFSTASLTFVEYYFTEDKNDVYYDVPYPTKEDLKINGNSILFAKSNASLFDRLYLALLIASRERENFKVVNDMLLSDQERYVKTSLGLFFQKLYRNENKNVQIVYTKSYKLAEKLSAVIEGNGVRVNDLSYEEDPIKKCRVVENGKAEEYSQTATQLASFFRCQLTHESVGGVYDIIFELGDLETSWEI